MGSSAYARAGEAAGGSLSLSLMWRELLSQYQVTDIASSVYRDRFGCWGFLDLWRTGAPAFTAADIEFLGHIAGPLTAALRHGLARTFIPATGGDQLPGPGQRVQRRRATARRRGRGGRQPAGDPCPPGRRPVADAARGADGRRPGCGGSDVAVSIEPSTAGDRVTVFARTCGLSPREAELLRHLAGGATTREVARQMFVSENTVQDHLKSIFDKSTARSRRALLARALGT
jgi:DNA-binding CsgD family transcriptional regulator